MSELVQTLSTYVPVLIARHLVNDPEPLSTPMQQRLQGAVFFVDISGFTKIAEKLAAHGLSGAEELTRHLNDYFGQMIGIIAAQGGDIVKFAGDALFAIWYNDENNLEEATLRATQCALALRDALNNYDAGDDILLNIRVAVGAGDVLALAVGGVLKRWEFLIAGPPLKQVGISIEHAVAGQVMLSPEAWQTIKDHVAGTTTEGQFLVERVTQTVRARAMPQIFPSENSIDALRGFVSGAILDRLDQVQSGWLAEHRRLTMMFLQVTNLDFTTPDAVDQLQLIMRTMQKGLYDYEGSVRQLIEDDKGTVFIAAFGLPPFTHQDDPLRGVQAAIEMEKRLNDLGFECRIGVTTGHVFCGPVGNSLRREYTLVGNVVNLSARLMGATKKLGVTILCDEATYQASRSRVVFQEMAPVSLKNIAEPVVTYSPDRETQTEIGQRAMVGRQLERNQLTVYLRELHEGKSNIVYVEGVTGIGKTRLIEDLAEQTDAVGFVNYHGSTTWVERATPYAIWNNILRKIFDVGSGNVNSTLRRKTVVSHLLKDKELMQYLPLLNAALQLNLPENQVTQDLTGSLRSRNTRSLMIEILKSISERGPMVITLDNAQWMDSTSWEFALAVSQEIKPILILIASRPMASEDSAEVNKLFSSVLVDRMNLKSLTPEDTQSLIRNYLEAKAVDNAIADLVYKQAQGNPFFSEELALALRESDSLLLTNGVYHLKDEKNATRPLSLPETLQGVITSRVDRLQARLQLTLKVSSVIGNMFSFRTLFDIYPIEPYKDQLEEHMVTLQQYDLIETVPSSNEVLYQFKQSLTQEVTYNLIPFMQRRQLHEAVAHWYERNFVYDLSPYFAFLAHHWQQAGDNDAAVKYLEKAGELSLRNGAFSDAVDFFSQALKLGAGAGKTLSSSYRLAHWERLLADSYWGMGQLPEARRSIEKALTWLHFDLPKERNALVRGIAQQGWLQFRHRLFPKRHFGRVENIPLTNEGAFSFRLLSELAFLEDETLISIYAGLQAMNLAETVGERNQVLARTYANAYVGFSAIHRTWLARLYKRAALTTIEKINKEHVTAPVLVRVGMYEVVKGQWTSARSYIEQAATIYAKIGDKRGLNDANYLLGFLNYFKGEFWQGTERFDKLAITGQLINNVDQRVIGLTGYAMHLLALGKTRLAMIQMELAKPLWASTAPQVSTIFYSQSLYAVVSYRQGQKARALEAANEALATIETAYHSVAFSAFMGMVMLVEVYARLAEDEASRATAIAALDRIWPILSRYKDTLPASRPYLHLAEGQIAFAKGHVKRAKKAWRSAQQSAANSAMPYLEALAHFAFVRSADKSDPARDEHYQQAWQRFEELQAEYYLDELKILKR